MDFDLSKMRSDKMSNENFEVVSTYSSDEANEDGYLFKITQIPLFKDCLFNYMTNSLFIEGGFQESNENKTLIPCLIDLINQCGRIVKKGRLKNPNDWFYSGFVELPTGKKTKIFICQNETGRFTVMLPQDY